jgi:hypothetical protein
VGDGVAEAIGDRGAARDVALERQDGDDDALSMTVVVVPAEEKGEQQDERADGESGAFGNALSPGIGAGDQDFLT